MEETFGQVELSLRDGFPWNGDEVCGRKQGCNQAKLSANSMRTLITHRWIALAGGSETLSDLAVYRKSISASLFS